MLDKHVVYILTAYNSPSLWQIWVIFKYSCDLVSCSNSDIAVCKENKSLLLREELHTIEFPKH